MGQSKRLHFLMKLCPSISKHPNTLLICSHSSWAHLEHLQLQLGAGAADVQEQKEVWATLKPQKSFVYAGTTVGDLFASIF